MPRVVLPVEGVGDLQVHVRLGAVARVATPTDRHAWHHHVIGSHGNRPAAQMGDQHRVGPLWLYLDNHAVTGQPRQTPPRSRSACSRRWPRNATGERRTTPSDSPSWVSTTRLGLGCHGAPEIDEAHRVFGGEHGSPAHRAAATAVIHGHQVDRVGGAEQMAAVAGHPARRAVAGSPALTGQVQQQRNRGHDATVARARHRLRQFAACVRPQATSPNAGNVDQAGSAALTIQPPGMRRIVVFSWSGSVRPMFAAPAP